MPLCCASSDWRFGAGESAFEGTRLKGDASRRNASIEGRRRRLHAETSDTALWALSPKSLKWSRGTNVFHTIATPLCLAVQQLPTLSRTLARHVDIAGHYLEFLAAL